MAKPNMELYIQEGESAAKKWRLPTNENYSNSRPVAVNRIAVIGGGTMGRGIAISAVRGGFETIIVDTDDKAINLCKAELGKIYTRLIAQKRASSTQVADLQRRLHFSTDLQDCRDVDLIIEAVFENLDIKKDLFRKLDIICKPTTVFGSNTSTIDITQMSSAVSKRSRVVGMHFFNPAHLLSVVEVVYGEHTSGEAVATAFDVCHRMRKHAVLVRTCRSFVFNRMMDYYIGQALRLIEQYRFTPLTIDKAVRRFGLPPGPMALLDVIGMDVMERIDKQHDKSSLGVVLKKLVGLKRYGRKSGRGWNLYESDGTKQVDKEVEKWISDLPTDPSIKRRITTDQDIVEFLFYPFVNEALRTVEEGIVSDMAYVDILWLYGGGWPRQYGGPMKWAEMQGWSKIYEYMQQEYKSTDFAEELKPSSLLKKLAGISSKY